MNYSPIPWMYSFYYLKYLFIIIPGSIAGEYLKEWLQSKSEADSPLEEKGESPNFIINYRDHYF